MLKLKRVKAILLAAMLVFTVAMPIAVAANEYSYVEIMPTTISPLPPETD